MPVSTAAAWLKIASALLLIGFGALIAAAAWPPLSGPTVLLVDPIFWPFDGAPSLAAPETRLMMAIGGGITAGWGLTIWQIADKLLPKDPAMARSILVPSILLWFVIDSSFSVLSGGGLNVIPNIAFLAALLWPLLRMETAALPARS